MAEREVVAVTGASGGVGRAIASEFARHGAAIGLIARGRAGLDAAAKDVAELGGVPSVTHRGRRRVRSGRGRGGRDRAAPRSDRRLDQPRDDARVRFLRRHLAGRVRAGNGVTYLAAVWGTKAALERMLPRDGGTVVTAGWQPTSAHVGPFDEVAVIGYPYASALLRADISGPRTWSSVNCDISDGIPAAEASRRKDHDTKTGWRGLSGDDPSQSEVFEGDGPG